MTWHSLGIGSGADEVPRRKHRSPRKPSLENGDLPGKVEVNRRKVGKQENSASTVVDEQAVIWWVPQDRVLRRGRCRGSASKRTAAWGVRAPAAQEWARGGSDTPTGSRDAVAATREVLLSQRPWTLVTMPCWDNFQFWRDLQVLCLDSLVRHFPCHL